MVYGIGDSRKETNMFAYVQIINSHAISYGQAKLTVSNDILTISALKDMANSLPTTIPITKIINFKQDTYYRWKRIQFNYNNKQYLFLYTNSKKAKFSQNKKSQSTIMWVEIFLGEGSSNTTNYDQDNS